MAGHREGSAERAAGWVVAAAVVVVVVAVAATFPRVAYREGADEGFYLRYARIVAAQGPAAFPQLFAAYLGDARNWLFPSPLRVLFLLAGGFAILFDGGGRALSWLSLLAHAGLAAATAWFGVRRLGAARGAAVALLVLSSPLLLGLSRRALADSFATLCGGLAIWLFLELLEQPDSGSAALAFAGALTLAVLSKETAVLLVPPLLAYAAGERLVRGTRWPWRRLLGACAGAGLVCLAVEALAAGGVDRLVAVGRIVLVSPETNAYAIQFGSGGWSRYLVDLLLLEPVRALLACAGLALVAARGRAGGFDRPLAFFATFAVGFLLVLGPFTKNARYGTLLELPLAVLAVHAAGALLPPSGAGRRVAMGAAIALLFAAGWWSFRLLFVDGGIYDPVTDNLARARHLIPWR